MKLVGDGRWILKIGGRWEVDPQNWCEMGGGLSKLVGDGRWTLKIGERWEADSQNWWELGLNN